ncbi:MAG: ATP synthase F1 subunit epsilon [Lachnospiraceae bacterium]
MADERIFELEIITPDRVFYKDRVSMVEFNTTEGEIGIYPGHIPLTVILKPGVLTITGEEKKEAALHTGFATILQDKVTIMAETVEWPDEIDRGRAEAARERAENRLREGKADTDIARAETALQRAMARIDTIK